MPINSLLKGFIFKTKNCIYVLICGTVLKTKSIDSISNYICIVWNCKTRIWVILVECYSQSCTKKQVSTYTFHTSHGQIRCLQRFDFDMT